MFPLTEARHVRVVGLKRGTRCGYSLHEVGVHAR